MNQNSYKKYKNGFNTITPLTWRFYMKFDMLTLAADITNFFFQNTKKQNLTILMTTNRNSYKKCINGFNTIPLIMPFVRFLYEI